MPQISERKWLTASASCPNNILLISVSVRERERAKERCVCLWSFYPPLSHLLRNLNCFSDLNVMCNFRFGGLRINEVWHLAALLQLWVLNCQIDRSMTLAVICQVTFSFCTNLPQRKIATGPSACAHSFHTDLHFTLQLYSPSLTLFGVLLWLRPFIRVKVWWCLYCRARSHSGHISLSVS